MKKRTVNKLIVVISVVLLVLVIHFLLIKPIWFWDLDRVELYSSDHNRGGQVTLTPFEAWIAIALYNVSPYSGEISAEPCCDLLALYVYFEDGSKLSISHGSHTKMNIYPPYITSNDSYRIESAVLIKYLEVLVSMYDLPSR